MAAAVEGPDKSLADDILDLKNQVKELERGRSEDENRNREMQAQMKTMKERMTAIEGYISMAMRLQDLRIATLVAQVSATVSSIQRQAGSTSRSPVVNHLMTHNAMDAAFRQLAEEVERAKPAGP
jgi:beta-phosphoglucomutase-like phosphatase (HAD superfamily)